MRKETLEIIKRYKLYPSHVSRIAKLPRETVDYYLTKKGHETRSHFEMEKAILNWHKELIKKRYRLLSHTSYAHLYSNVDTIFPQV